jgi:hypothetical protein
MAPPERAPQPTELIYLPQPSWAPPFTALGIAVLVVGLFAGWVYEVLGAIVTAVAIAAWVGRTRDSIARLPRSQRASTAVLTAAPLRRD